MATTIRVSWPANPAAEQVVKYELLQSKDGAPFTSLGAFPGTIREISNPYPGVYRFQVKAINIAGESPLSDIGSGPDIPSKPGTPTVEVIES